MVNVKKELQVVYSPALGEDVVGTVHEGETADFARPRGIAVKSTYPAENEKNYAYYPVLHHEHFKNLEGKILTVCDASFSDEKQREAVKQIFKNEMRDWFNTRIENLRHVVLEAADKK